MYVCMHIFVCIYIFSHHITDAGCVPAYQSHAWKHKSIDKTNLDRVPDVHSAVTALQECVDTKRVLVVSPEGADSVALANDLADAGLAQVCMYVCMYACMCVHQCVLKPDPSWKFDICKLLCMWIFNTYALTHKFFVQVVVLEGGLSEWERVQGPTQGGPCCIPPGKTCICMFCFAFLCMYAFGVCVYVQTHTLQVCGAEFILQLTEQRMWRHLGATVQLYTHAHVHTYT